MKREYPAKFAASEKYTSKKMAETDKKMALITFRLDICMWLYAYNKIHTDYTVEAIPNEVTHHAFRYTQNEGRK